jgi:hypothetical protein
VAIEIFQDHWRKADILIARAQVRKWHLASFRCDAEFGPLSAAYRTSSSHQARFVGTRLVLPEGRSIPFEVTTGTILARIRYA